MQRNIVHLDLDSFFVSVERLLNSDLIGKPVIVGGTSDRGVVSSCSYEARKYGVRSAMPMRQARQLCPEASIVKGDYDQYAYYSKMVTDIISEKAPVVEKASIDEHYLDLSGMDKYFGCLQWTKELRQKIIHETGLPISFGLSSSKTVAKMATNEGKPSGEKEVMQGKEKNFLAPLSVRKIPMVGAKTFNQLSNLGITQVGALQKMDINTVTKLMGINGIALWKKANAQDDTPVIPYHERKSLSKEHTFGKDTIDMAQIKRYIISIVDELAYDLRRCNKLTTCLTLKLRYYNFETYTQQIKLNPTTSDRHLAEQAILLFQKLYNKRMPIRLIGVKCSNLVTGAYQIDMFSNAITELNLAKAVDGIKTQFGSGIIKKAINL